VGKEQGYLLRITRFWALGFAVNDFCVHVFDLPDGFGIDGLIGLSFLRRFNVELRFAETAPAGRPYRREVTVTAVGTASRAPRPA